MSDLRGRHGGAAMAVTFETRGAAVIVRPSGDVDLSGSPTLRQELRRVQAGAPGRLVIDLAGVPYMDSSGVATLVEAMQVARRADTKLVLCGLQDKVRSIFEIARLDTVFAIVADVDAAIAG
ncbi:MAG TPA: STAS domain-containing protein [Phycisphaerales bacterium]|nr:STAS domain-containing protein [Phycisphaerales bacterium]